MAITYCPKTQAFYLDGKDLTYAFFINEIGYPCHLYFGASVAHDDLRFLCAGGGNSFCATPPGLDDISLNYMKFHPELCFFGTGDYREPAFLVENSAGDRLSDLRYISHEILTDKPKISGIPSLRGGETLVVHLKDSLTDFGADLYYTVYDDASVIARRAVYRNGGKSPCTLRRAYSFSIGLNGQEYEILDLCGKWARERHIERIPMHRGVVSVDSKRGSSSAALNPFLAVLSQGATESTGQAYGFNLVYSSSYVLKAEGTETGETVITGGINDFDFSWQLAPSEKFEAPEVVIAYSDEGIGGMSRAFHDAYRNHLIPPEYVFSHRPIVINNWEATYFNFDTEKLKSIVDAVEGTGIDTFVLDDGWFGKRDSSASGLGDWVVNTEKLNGGLGEIIKHVHSKGMRFGLWFEPEMVSEDSDLFRAHPDYAIGVPARPRCYSRHQFVLDLTRAEVRDYVVEAVNRILRENDIDYVKWDSNRNLTEFFSTALEPSRQAEFSHRYVLGLYDLCERIVRANPKVFFEGCSGGGARFDPAMLAYFQQIWTSDNSDAEERTKIQYGTSIAYPLSAMSCHISEVPNHQVHRTTPMDTRANIAHLGATGYELDTSAYTDEDRATVRAQVEEFKRFEHLVQAGDLYRIHSPFDGNYFNEMIVSKDKCEALLSVYQRLALPNPEVRRVTLAGLHPHKTYFIEEMDITAKGVTLMRVGIPIKFKTQDFCSMMFYIREIDNI